MFVGRAAELEILGRLLATEERATSVVLSGPPGMGKTTLCEQVAQRAGESGALVAWGRAWQLGGAPPFHPWARVLSRLQSQMACGQELAAAHAALLEGSDEASPQARAALFERLRAALHSVSLARRLVIILDDL